MRLSTAIGLVWMDLVHAARSVKKSRAFAIICVASLGIGIGTFLAIVLLARSLAAPPPGVNQDGLVELLVIPEGELLLRSGTWALEEWSYPDFEDLRESDTGMALTGWALGETTIQASDQPNEVLTTMFVSANYFRTVGVSLVRGPGFDGGAVDEAGQAQVAVGFDFWQNRLGSDPEIIGKPIVLGGAQYVVAGVVQDGFRGHLKADAVPPTQLWIPLDRHPALLASDGLRFRRNVDWLRIHGRLSPDVSIDRARAAVSAVMSGIASRSPGTNEFKDATVEQYWPVGARFRPQNSRVMLGVFAVSATLLLIICLNISGMMLVRSSVREREISTRQALGASSRQLVRYLLSEAMILGGLGGALAIFVLFAIPAGVSWWLCQPNLCEPLPSTLKPDAAVYAIGIGLCLATSLAIGLMPAIRFSRPGLLLAMKDDVGGGSRRVRSRTSVGCRRPGGSGSAIPGVQWRVAQSGAHHGERYPRIRSHRAVDRPPRS